MKACLVFGILLALGLPAGAQQVAEEELRSAGQEIEFENYSGPYERVDTAEEIKAIGFLLAGSLQQDGNAGRFLDKYRILRALDPREQGKFDADILSIEAAARVDHIENVRRILAGYLEGAFAYNASDARLLARFATVYNAVYRGNLGYFGAEVQGGGHVPPDRRRTRGFPRATTSGPAPPACWSPSPRRRPRAAWAACPPRSSPRRR